MTWGKAANRGISVAMRDTLRVWQLYDAFNRARDGLSNGPIEVPNGDGTGSSDDWHAMIATIFQK